MATVLSKSKDWLEQAKFLEDGDGNICVRTCISGDGITISSVDAATDGQTSWRVTTQTIGDTAEAIPAAALADRNSLTILNLSTTDKLYLNRTNAVTANTVDGTNSGYIVNTESEWNVDLDSTAPIFAICESGKSVVIQIVEFAKA